MTTIDSSLASALAPGPAPVADAERLRVVDMLRGCALLGILLMNIQLFAEPDHASEAYRSDPSSVNFWAFAVVTLLFEGKMRALFSMMFGASLVLFLRTKAGRDAHVLFARRTVVLLVMGLIQAHLLLWQGEILFLYAVCGVVVYFLRGVNPRVLLLAVPVVALLDFAGNAVVARQIREVRLTFVEARALQDAGQPLDERHARALEAWTEIEETIFPSRAHADESTRKMRGSYAEVASVVRPLAVAWETTFLLPSIPDAVALMLLGLALFRLGFLGGTWPRKTYVRIAVVGYGLGLPLRAWGQWMDILNHPTLEASIAYLEATPFDWPSINYPFQRILLVMAHISTLILVYRWPPLQPLFRRLEAVGQTALSNYFLHTIVCTLTFFGYGLGLYGRLELVELYAFCVAVWVVQLVVSPWWLRRFHFGPFEWAWRAATYLRFPRFARTAA